MSAAIVIVNWNSGDLLRRCLSAVALQTVPAARVVVFDNASTDGSLAGAGDACPGVEIHHWGSNIGFAAANNRAAATCAGCEWLCLLNPDAFPEPGWLEALLRTADQHRACDSFASLVLQAATPGLIDSAGDEYRRSGIAVHRMHGRALDEVREHLAEPHPVFAASAAAAMHRRTVFLECGGFDESLFAFYEDVDLGLRLRLAGHEAMLVPGAVVHHVGGGSTGGSGGALGGYYGQRNFILTFFKNMPLPLLLSGMPAHGWAVLRGIAAGFSRKRGLRMLGATFGALVRMPGCLRRRRAVQASRRISIREFRDALGGEAWLS